MPDVKKKPRLDQLFSNLGYGSRREVHNFLRDSRIEVEGQNDLRADTRVDPMKVQIDGEKLDAPEGLLVLINKPLGFVCSHNEQEGRTIFEILPSRWLNRSPQVVGIGRLDKDTSGLFLATDQHELVHQLTSPKNHVEKTYEVSYDGNLPADAVQIVSSGNLLLKGDPKPCLPAKLSVHAPTQGLGRATLVLSEGRNLQVRRMFAALGTRVIKLHRSQFAHARLEGVGEGQYKCLPLDFFSKK